jgi:hypothetical protein
VPFFLCPCFGCWLPPKLSPDSRMRSKFSIVELELPCANHAGLLFSCSARIRMMLSSKAFLKSGSPA